MAKWSEILYESAYGMANRGLMSPFENVHGMFEGVKPIYK